MRSLHVIAAVAALAAGAAGLALPASAAGVSTCQVDKVLGPRGVLVDRIDLMAQQYAIQLRQLGYNVESVQGWSGCVKAFITDPGGGSHMEFFDPDTLQPLDPNS